MIPKIRRVRHPETGKLVDEEWRPIKDYETRYHVSNYGRVKSIRTDKLILSSMNTNGYQKVVLSGGSRGSYKTCSVHRLLMIAFFGDSDLHVDHKNRKRSYNKIFNLEFVTPRENQIRAVTKKLPVGVHFVKEQKSRPFRALMKIKKARKHLGYFESAELASAAYRDAVKQLSNG